MKIKELNREENDMIQLFFELFPKWKEPIYKQICNSRIERYNNMSNYSTYFFLSGKAEPLNIKSKMPVEIILGNIQIPNECILNTGIFNIISPCTFLTLENDVIALRLYFNNGIIEELEMYNIAGYKINLSMCKSKKRTYIVHERTIKDRLTIKSQ